MSIDFDTLSQLESAADPNGAVFKKMLEDLMVVSEGYQPVSRSSYSSSQQKPWTRVFPFCGSTVDNRVIMEQFPDFVISDHPTYVQGVVSLAKLFDRLSKMFSSFSKSSVGRVLVVSSFATELCEMFDESDPMVTSVDYVHVTDFEKFLDVGKYAVVVIDHTSVTCSLNKAFHVCYAAGVKIVEGLFYYSPAVDNGWSGVFGDEQIMIQHTKDGMNIGPREDPTRVMYYTRDQYAQFTGTTNLTGDAKKFYYELKNHGMLYQYTSYNVGSSHTDHITFKVPVTSSPDLVLVTLDKKFANGMFSTHVDSDRTSAISEQSASIFSTRRDYAFEMRKKLFDDCVMFLVGKQKGSDLMSEAVRYITAHNYSDLFEGSRVISTHSMGYSDALCAAFVCAIQAYSLRYDLTHDSIRALANSRSQANARLGNIFYKLTYVLWKWSKYAAIDIPSDALAHLRTKLASQDLIPGVCYDLYVDRHYTIGASWVESGVRGYFDKPMSSQTLDDPVTDFLGDVIDASTADFLLDQEANEILAADTDFTEQHDFIPDPDPIAKFQDVYDNIFPGNSVVDLPNIAELRKTRDVDITMDFVGRIKVNMDEPRPEALHEAMPVRTSALPLGRAGLVDSILASAKRNFSVPDMHAVSDVWKFGERLVGEFLDQACVPGAKSVCAQYRNQPITFNVTSYCEWASGKSESYYKALMGDIPDELVSLQLDKYTSILKSRVKPKLSVTAQHELGQPQVVVHQSKKETALFSGIFRKIFERFDSILMDKHKSAGRSSDKDITDWATKMKAVLLAGEMLEGDSSMYDKSQSLLAMVIEICMFRALGVGCDVIASLKRTLVGNVGAQNAGLAFILAMQRKSGHADTMIGNLIYNCISMGHCVGWQNIHASIYKGDDNLLVLAPGVLTGPGAAEIAQKMGRYFNLESKMILHVVPGFSSGGFVPCGDKVHFFSDPVKLLELLGEREADPARFLDEKFASYRDRVSSYNVNGLPGAIQGWVRSRYNTQVDVMGLIEAFMTVASDRSLFAKIKGVE